MIIAAVLFSFAFSLSTAIHRQAANVKFQVAIVGLTRPGLLAASDSPGVSYSSLMLSQTQVLGDCSIAQSLQNVDCHCDNVTRGFGDLELFATSEIPSLMLRRLHPHTLESLEPPRSS